MHKLKLLSLLFLTLSLSSCASKEASPSQLLKASWFTPDQKSCDGYGGEYEPTDKVCEANLDNALKICQANNAHLPSIDEYIEISVVCGGLVVRRDDEFESSRDPAYDSKPNKKINAHNKEYQACLESLILYNFGEYLSSTIQDDFVAETICHNGVCTRYTRTIKDQKNYQSFSVYYGEVGQSDKDKNLFIACKR